MASLGGAAKAPLIGDGDDVLELAERDGVRGELHGGSKLPPSPRRRPRDRDTGLTAARPADDPRRMRLRILPLLFALAACGKPDAPAPVGHASAAVATSAPRPSASAAPTSTASAAAAAAVAKMVSGEKLAPALLPAAAVGATDRVDRPAKEGFVEAVYKKGKDDLATVTITDTAGVPAVRDDYRGSKETAAGYPLKTSGYTKTAVLVADRFQIQIQSPRLKAPERKAWIEKMDLKALSAVQ